MKPDFGGIFRHSKPRRILRRVVELLTGAVTRDDTNLPGFDDIYLPDAYVLGVREEPTEIAFDLDVYLRGKARLVFANVKRFKWLKKLMRPVPGADAEADYGSIDSLIGHGGSYHISGEWGELEIESDTPKIQFLE